MSMMYLNGVALDANDYRVQRLIAEEQAQYTEAPAWKHKTVIYPVGTPLSDRGVGCFTSDAPEYVGTEGCRRVYPKRIQY